MNHLTQEERFLHRMAERALKAIHVKATADEEFAVAAIKRLIGPCGAISFDQITKTKAIDKLLVESTLSVLSVTVDNFRQLINRPLGDETSAESKRQTLVDYLVSALRSRSSQADPSDSREFGLCVRKAMHLFVHFGYFIDSTANPALSVASREMFRSRITSCLNSLMSSHTSLINLPYDVIVMVHQKHKSDDSCRFVVNLDDTATETLHKAWKTLGRIVKKVNLLQSLRFPMHGWNL
jgi:DNA polymerase phi